MLKRVDYETVIRQRQENFQHYHRELADYNQITFDEHGGQYAFCYPFLPKKLIEKQLLHQQKFFIPALWSDVLNREEEFCKADKVLCRGLLPLPIDHRYKIHDVEPLIRLIKEKVYVDE
jgi:dTDP-4-amino-4,6-dideoxygalactose transaminase